MMVQSRSADKINMYSHLIKKNISMPKTVFLSKSNLTSDKVAHLFDELGSPLIIKEPSTSFSLRVEKVNDIPGFFRVARRFIRLSDWIVVQQYIESRYDWRGGAERKASLCLQVYDSSDTFKIQASVNGHLVYCGVESVSPDKVPPHVIRLGIDAANAIGSGLYGVDIKNNNGDAYVIEVNDNPSIERRTTAIPGV
jgi:glutathione synthase/RimK-type ligase-like ATP-grasp enzyme